MLDLVENWTDVLDVVSQVPVKDNKFKLLARAGRQVSILLIYTVLQSFVRIFITQVFGLSMCK